jgi:fructose-specific phosphotransferase system component IIB
LEDAVDWAGHKFEAGDAVVIKEIHTVAGKLTEGKKRTSEEVSKGIKNVKYEISKLGKKTEPKNKQRKGSRQRSCRDD